jgi:trimethylamine--corrinoid protein Co-methyltransferase
MDLKGLSGGQYRPLSEEQVKTIHEASLSILEKTGFTYESGLDDTLTMLEKAGVTVDRDKSRIIFPRDLVIERAAIAPEQVIMYSRDGQK